MVEKKFQIAAVVTTLYVLALVGKNLSDSVRSRLNVSKISQRERDQLNVNWRDATRLLGQIAGIADNSDDENSDISNFKQHLSKCITHSVRMRMRYFEGSIRCNVYKFLNEDGGRMETCARSEPDSSLPRIISAPNSPLFWSAKLGTPINIPDTEQSWHPFDDESPSTIRSKYIMPVLHYLDEEEGGKSSTLYCIGVVSIESNRPFHFWSYNTGLIISAIEPQMSLIQLMLEPNPNRLKVDRGEISE